MKNLKINIWTGILDIINCILFAISWPVIFSTAASDAFGGTNLTSGTGVFFYVMAALGIILNIVALIKSRKNNISIVGPVLGIIGNALFLITAAMAFPAIVVIIIGTFFIFLHQPTKNTKAIN
ncbi:transporter [Companilactobacillus paralimentarius]|uniref:transporter n=1 Tax=Companilactobacillus paralimentarius TaxID=83526 RepID=UPI002852F8A6|nr:transporter [Companilactobacillus paralimentarius]MDR4933579.1 transporter [Companilactobacillus paralimentarius]